MLINDRKLLKLDAFIKYLLAAKAPIIIEIIIITTDNSIIEKAVFNLFLLIKYIINYDLIFQLILPFALSSNIILKSFNK